MAVIWQKQQQVDGKVVNYEVRSHGRTRRLYTNGVFHSQFSPARPVAGSVWDLLLLPSFMLPLGEIKRVLVLGVGGGAVLKQLEYFHQPECIVGVELNPVHLQVAKRFFGVQGQCFELIEADAIQWLKNYRGEKFDLIIDDLFGENEGEPARAIDVDESWSTLLLKHLSPSGALIINFDSPKVMKRTELLKQKKLVRSGKLKSAWCFSTPLYENNIACFSRLSQTRSEFRGQLKCFNELDESKASCHLNYRLHALKLPSE